jgi:hypothetical protein
MTGGLFDDVLTDRRGFEADGRSEEFLPEPVGPCGLAILTRPAASTHETGFVLCRSPGPEQEPLQRLEAMLARALAEKGFPSIRIRKGFGDEGTGSNLDLDESLAEAHEAALALVSVTGVKQVAVVGELLGAATALVTADRLELPFAVLVCPSVSGGRYLDGLYRRHLIAALARPALRGQSRGPLEQQLRRAPVAVRGVRLTRASYEHIAAVDLRTVANGFAGSALVVGATPGAEPEEALRELASSFNERSRVALHFFDDPFARDFGEATIRRTRGSRTQDVRLDLDLRLVRAMLDWALAECG